MILGAPWIDKTARGGVIEASGMIATVMTW
jgi:hypothetical protein